MVKSGFGQLRSLMHRLDGEGKMSTPTIESKPLSATTDCDLLRKAMRGPGTNENVLIEILAGRTNHQRQELCEQYEILFKKPLIDAVKDDTSGDFRRILVYLLTDTPYLLAGALYKAISGMGTKESVLIEVLVSLWNDEFKAVAEAYKQVLKDHEIEDPGRTLLDDIKGDTSGDFGFALTCLAQCQRDELSDTLLKSVASKGVSEALNMDQVAADAKELYDITAGRCGTSDKRLALIVCCRTPFHLKATADAYLIMHGSSLADDIASDTSGDFKTLLLSILGYATNRPKLLAKWINATIAGLGTKDQILMRLIITRSEIDLADVMLAYQELYGRTLKEDIIGDTSGDYRKTLLKLMNC